MPMHENEHDTPMELLAENSRLREEVKDLRKLLLDWRAVGEVSMPAVKESDLYRATNNALGYGYRMRASEPEGSNA